MKRYVANWDVEFEVGDDIPDADLAQIAFESLGACPTILNSVEEIKEK